MYQIQVLRFETFWDFFPEYFPSVVLVEFADMGSSHRKSIAT
jgi:hypothetical protein